MEPIRILYVNGGIMHRGGIESYMMNYYRNIDRNKIQIDFIVHGFSKGAYDDEIRQLGGKIYNVPVKSKDFKGNINALREIFSSGQYKIVHSHMDAMSTVVLKEAKKCGIPVRIAHSHNTQHLTRNLVKYLLNEYARMKIKNYATHYFACSKAAGVWLYGQEAMAEGLVKIMHNAIDLNNYRNNEDVRHELREKYGIGDQFVVGHVGRFDYQKNHKQLLEIFKAILNLKPKSKLVLIGDGILRNKIVEKIKKLHIEDKVILLGERSDVGQLLNMFDIFLLPSHFEGLPVVLIEAQAAGIYCFVSDTVTKEADITKNLTYLSLNTSAEDWAKKILNTSNISNHIDNTKKIIDAGYSIETEAKKLQNTYLSLQEYAENENNSII